MDVETTVVGAGPYGLSIAAHLSAAKIPFHIFGNPLESWRTFMPEGMVLKSEPFASNLWDPARRYSLKRYMGQKGQSFQAVGRPLSRELFLEYADWFRQNTAPTIDGRRIVNIDDTGEGFRIELNDGSTLSSRRVVLATGHMAFRQVPDELAALPEPQVVHCARMGHPGDYKGKDVTIIGAGQSALETAAILHEAGAHVRVLVRRNQLEWNAPSKPRALLRQMFHPDAGVASGWKSWAISELPRTFRWYFPADKRHRFVAGSYGPSGSWWLRSRVEGLIPISLQTRIESATVAGDKVHMRLRGPNGTTEAQTDHLISATGYRVDIDKIDYLAPNLRQRIARENAGIPALTASLETSVSKLHIVGIASSPVFGPIMRFMYGAKHAAPIIAGHLKAPSKG